MAASMTLYSGPRHFDLERVDADEDRSMPALLIADMLPGESLKTEIRIFMCRSQLRELRELLVAAPLGEDQYDVVYAAAIRAWEAV